MERDQEFLEYVVKSIVKYPDQVKTTRTSDEMGVLLSLVVAKEDMGQVIGKAGATASAIRLLTKLTGMSNKSRVSVKINEPE